ncbi:MAG: tRNA-specific adenosine deaminase, partial [Deltaproteobacteria bacterium]
MQSLDEKYMLEALVEAQAALDQGEFPVGCLFVAEQKILARGRRVNSSEAQRNEIDHAEMVTLRGLLAKHPGCDLSQVTVYCTMEPCLMCYTTLLLSGVRRFVWGYEDVMGGGTGLLLQDQAPLFAQMQVELIGKVLRNQSLHLFQQFFKHHSYWQ